MKFINVHCPKCQQSIEVEAPRRGLSLPMAAAVLVVGAAIGIACFAAVPRHARLQRTVWVAPGKAQELADVLPTVNLQELSAGTALRSTSRDGTRSMVIFNNKTSQKLQLFWLDYNGQRKSYGTLEPFSNRPMQTYATHPWLLVDDKDTPVALFVSLPGQCTATIKGHS